MEALKNKKLFLLDMDGTIYLDNQLFDGVKEFLEYVKNIGGKAVFLTNNSSKGVSAYIEKLQNLGIKATTDDFLTSVDATIKHLLNKNYKKIYVFGTDSFYNQLAESGLSVTKNREDGIDCLCMGFDTELTFKKLEDACILLGKDIDYIATNPDWVCPTWYGSVPDCGSISQIINTATGRMPLFIGKPQPTMVQLAMEKNGFREEETVVIGDRLYTDIASGVNAGVSTVFVLSGEGKMSDVQSSQVKPEYIYESINALYKDLIK